MRRCTHCSNEGTLFSGGCFGNWCDQLAALKIKSLPYSEKSLSFKFSDLCEMPAHHFKCSWTSCLIQFTHSVFHSWISCCWIAFSCSGCSGADANSQLTPAYSPWRISNRKHACSRSENQQSLTVSSHFYRLTVGDVIINPSLCLSLSSHSLFFFFKEKSHPYFRGISK